MGLIDDLKKWAHPYEDEDEEYEDDFAELGSRDTGAFAAERPSRRERDRAEARRNKVVTINATTQHKVCLLYTTTSPRDTCASPNPSSA